MTFLFMKYHVKYAIVSVKDKCFKVLTKEGRGQQKLNYTAIFLNILKAFFFLFELIHLVRDKMSVSLTAKLFSKKDFDIVIYYTL